MQKKIHIFQKKNKEEYQILKKISKKISIKEIKSKKIQKIISDMQSFLKNQPDGAALAAPQIGKNLRIFIVSPYIFSASQRKISKDDLIFINPTIIKKSKKTHILEEGCFSVRWWYGEVSRAKNITIEAYNLKGQKKTWGAGNILAQVFQHEIEHLNGILFCEKAKNLKKMSLEQRKKLEIERKKLEQKNKNKPLEF